ncbi:MAG: tetratricopeptide repeat protein, partial [Myxococcales bacterium]|nr:tetratricopeptide repeat protein [Myxococcales bacterium]
LWSALWCARARGLAVAERNAEADAALESAAQYTDPDDEVGMIRLLRERASARGLARRWTEAREDYERALVLHRAVHGDGHPGALELELELALAMSGDALTDEALRRLDDVVDRLTQRVGPLHGRTLRARRARCIVAAGRDGPAAEEVCLLGLADAYREAGRPRQAASCSLDRALALASLGRHDEAAGLLRDALADPASPWPPLRTTASLARVESEAGRAEVALQLLGDRLRNDDERSEVADSARQTEIDLLLEAGRVDEAELALQRAVRLAVGDPIGFVGRRGMLAAARGDLRSALVDLETGMLMATVEVDVMGPFARRLGEVRAALDPTDPRAREMGEVALDLYEYGPGTARQADEVRRWLASLPAPRLVRD